MKATVHTGCADNAGNRRASHGVREAMWVLEAIPAALLLAIKPAPPTVEREFADLGGWVSKAPHGSVRATQLDAAADGRVAQLLFPGDPRLGPRDRVGPVRWPVEIGTVEQVHYGSYRARLQFASCTSSEELVSAFFVYANDGRDHNGNGIIDNAEIDIEVLCGEPHFVWMTVWTDYERKSGRVRCRKQTRVVDMRDGSARDTPASSRCASQLESMEQIDGVSVPDFPGERFYEVGFDWYPDRVSVFVVLDDREITLWSLTDPTKIPQRPGQLRLQLWHAAAHWHRGGPADYPAHDGVLRADWVRYWGGIL